MANDLKKEKFLTKKDLDELQERMQESLRNSFESLNYFNDFLKKQRIVAKSYLTIEEASIKLDSFNNNVRTIFEKKREKQEVLNLTSSLFDSLFDFKGSKSNEKQFLHFPIDNDTEVPDIVINAYVIFLADFLVDGKREATNELDKILSEYIIHRSISLYPQC